MVPISWAEISKNEVKQFLTNKSSTSGLWVFEWIFQKAPKRHPEGIFLMNHHHSQTKCKNFPGLIISRCVFEGPSRIHCYLLSRMLTRSRQRAREHFNAPWDNTLRTPTTKECSGKFRLRNSDGWWDVLGRLFRTRSVMWGLWDDHFRDFGYPPKFYKGQDAGFDSGSSS